VSFRDPNPCASAAEFSLLSSRIRVSRARNPMGRNDANFGPAFWRGIGPAGVVCLHCLALTGGGSAASQIGSRVSTLFGAAIREPAHAGGLLASPEDRRSIPLQLRPLQPIRKAPEYCQRDLGRTPQTSVCSTRHVAERTVLGEAQYRFCSDSA
jgi:hypothetical protein